MSIVEFLNQLNQYPLLWVSTILTLGVILVNGWTDAPNAIATCVSTKAISARKAIVMAAIFNFLGVLVMTLITPSVAMTIYNLVDFGANGQQSVIALCAAMTAIVVWATAAWKFGIPTSESHALIAGISGAAIALTGISGVNGGEWVKVLIGLFLSTILGFGLGFLSSKLIELIFKNKNRRKCQKYFQGAQIASGAGMAFMHGAQDGQKFMAIFLLGGAIMDGTAGSGAMTEIPIWLMIICSLVMGLGTSIGGYRIIKAVGMDMVKLKPYQGFAADFAATACLLLSSFTGIPVSTTHTKTTAIMGAGASKRLSNVKWSVVKELILTWVFTFPGCGLLGFGMAKLFLVIFGG